MSKMVQLRNKLWASSITGSRFVIIILIPSCLNIVAAYANPESNQPASTSNETRGAFSSVPDNVQRMGGSDKDKAWVTVEIPDKSVVKYSFPNLKFVNDSSELLEENESIAPNGTMISGVATKFQGRFQRSYPYSPRRKSGYYMMPYNNGRHHFDRYDVRNSFEESPSSSWGGSWFNKLKRRTSLMMSPMMSSYDKQQMQMMNQADEPEMSATSYGGGWGQYGKGVNKSAVGLLGFLSLLSLIQNVLNQTSTATMRRKRDLVDKVESLSTQSMFTGEDMNDWDDSVIETVLVAPYVLPMLNTINNAQMGVIPVGCTFQAICFANQGLIKKFGDHGNTVGKLLSEFFSENLTKGLLKRKTNTRDNKLSDAVLLAGQIGREGKDCRTRYNMKCTKQSSRLPVARSKLVGSQYELKRNK